MFGKCHLKAYVKENTQSVEDCIQSQPYLELFIEPFDGVSNFSFDMNELLILSGRKSLNEMEVYVIAYVEEPYFDDSSWGSFIASLHEPAIKLKFMSRQPRAFKPNHTYNTYIAVSQQDGTRLPLDRIQNSRIKLTINDSSSYELLVPIGLDSLCSYSFIPPIEAQLLTIKATFVENGIESTHTSVTERAISYQSASRTSIHVSSSTSRPAVGQFMIFVVKVSAPVETIFYHIVSSSRIVLSNNVVMRSRQVTFDVAVRKEMGPSAHLIVYFITDGGELVADSYNFHVDMMNQVNDLNVTINRRKDLTGDTVEILAYTRPQSIVAFAALDASIMQLYKLGSMITDLMLLDELYSFDQHANQSFMHTWWSPAGWPVERVFVASSSYAIDAASTFAYSGLQLFTDLTLIIETACNRSHGLAACLLGATCFQLNFDRCDGVCQCQLDCVDEAECPERADFMRSLHERFSPKIERVYQLSWLWHEEFTLPDGRVQFQVDLPKSIANYELNAFAISKLSGLSIMKTHLNLAATRQFYIQVELPDECRLGEQVGVRIDAFNFQPHRIEALVILHASTAYKFVNVEPDGLVSSFSPRLSGGQHHVLLIIQPGQSRRIHIPIVALRVGEVEVTVEAMSGANRDVYVGAMQVRHEGVTNQFNLPFLLALLEKPSHKFEFDLPLNETFLFALQQQALYVPDSPTAHLSVSGDVCGPYLVKDGHQPILANAIKKSSSTVEAGLFSFGSYVYDLIYMRQGHGGKGFDFNSFIKTLEWTNYEYLRVMTSYSKQGYFSQYGTEGTQSVWLTSWAITVIRDAVDPVWERYNLFIDPELLRRSAMWLMDRQNPLNGSWMETGPLYDRKFASNLTKDWDNSNVRLNLSLTAQCLIALSANLDIRGKLNIMIYICHLNIILLKEWRLKR